jgi:uncharacterized membrane protein
MHSGIITAAIVHNLSLAVAYGGPLFGKYALRPAVLEDAAAKPVERGKILEDAWSRFSKINRRAHLAIGVTWLLERHAIKTHISDQHTRKLVALKDVLVSGVLVTGLANTIAGEMMKRDFPNGVPIPAAGNTTPENAAKIERYVTFFRIMGSLNMALVGGSIALGPVITAAAFRASRRSLISRLLGK